MPSKGVMDRHRVAKAIVATARTHAPQVGDRLQEILAPFVPEGETLPDLTGLQLALADYLEAQIDAIVEADEIHLEELDDDDEPRRRRDEAADELYGTVVAIREMLVGAFGSERADAIHGIDGRTSQDPLRLFRQASRMLKRLNEQAASPPLPRLDGAEVDLARLAVQLQPALDETAQAIQEVDREIREAESTNRDKDLALSALDTAVSSVGRVLTGFDDLAGFPEFSDKIRFTLPARRHRETVPEQESPLPEAGDGTPSPAPGDAPPTEVPPPSAPPADASGEPAG
jgi:hypothetical protein